MMKIFHIYHGDDDRFEYLHLAPDQEAAEEKAEELADDFELERKHLIVEPLDDTVMIDGGLNYYSVK